MSREEAFLSGECDMKKQRGGAAAKRLSARRARTYAEQVQLIKNKGFIVDDESECVALLRKVNYTRLAAYFGPFRRANGAYSPNVNFRRIRGIYEFDGKMRAVLFECIGEIECYLRGQFAYFSGHRHGAFGYLEEGTFSDKHDHERFLGQIDEYIEKNRKILTVQHHEEEQDGKFPIWVTVEFFTIGMLSYFYRDLKRNDRKTLAIEMYGTSPNRLISWLQCLVRLRNRCAHYSRLYDCSFSTPPKMPPNITFIDDHERLFAQIVLLKLLYPDPVKWNSGTLAKIEELVTEYGNDICLEHIGFPENWKELLQYTVDHKK